jgi:putative SOS response-associated peptidase YedK
MCGRFTIAISVGFFDRFQIPRQSSPPLESHFNITPSQEIPVILTNAEGDRELHMMSWGLVPSWASDPAIGHHPINARAESLTEKPMFTRLVRERRCLIPASGFFEWKKMGNEKIPHYIHRRDDALFTFAGLYDIWHREGKLCTCTIVTTEPNQIVRPLHDRMPAILREADEPLWLARRELDRTTLYRILSPYPSEDLEAYRVSRRVNDTSNDSAEVIKPLTEQHLFGGERK